MEKRVWFPLLHPHCSHPREITNSLRKYLICNLESSLSSAEAVLDLAVLCLLFLCFLPGILVFLSHLHPHHGEQLSSASESASRFAHRQHLQSSAKKMPSSGQKPPPQKTACVLGLGGYNTQNWLYCA